MGLVDGFSALSKGQTEGGEALLSEAGLSLTTEPSASLSDACWHALWTHSHCERVVSDHLSARGFDVFFPTIEIWSRRGGTRHRIQAPMFPGYLFIRHAMDKTSYIEVRKTHGLVGILGERWDCLAVIPDDEIAAIQTLWQSRLSVRPHMFLRDGQRVRIIQGPLTNAEGILVRQKPNTGLFVVSVNLLQRSVAVEVDCTWVVAA